MSYQKASISLTLFPKFFSPVENIKNSPSNGLSLELKSIHSEMQEGGLKLSSEINIHNVINKSLLKYFHVCVLIQLLIIKFHQS